MKIVVHRNKVRSQEYGSASTPVDFKKPGLGQDQVSAGTEVTPRAVSVSISYFFLFIIIATLFVIATIYHIDQYSRVLWISSEIEEMERRLDELKEREGKLELQVCEYYDYEAVMKRAEANGMVYPEPGQVYWLAIPEGGKEEQ